MTSQLSPDPQPTVETLAAAREVLEANHLGRWTVPARGLYPHQWNWDSALIALGWAALDVDRAWTELESLVGMAHPDGMVPHIAFSPDAVGYMPGPDWWGDTLRGADGRRTSGISQPPVAATCLRLLWEQAPDERRARPLVAALHRWHSAWIELRGAGAGGEPVVVHPWETGRDNAIEWDEPLSVVEPTTTPFERADLTHVDAGQRPTREHYARYLRLVELSRDLGWDQRRLARELPFRVHDAATTAILAAGCADLAWVADRLGETDIAEAAAFQAAGLTDALRTRAMSDGSVYSVDLEADVALEHTTCGLVLAALAPGIGDVVVDRAVQLAVDGPLASELGLRSTAPDDPAWQPRTYWRGPVWANITWLASLAFERAGRADAASVLRDRLFRFAGDVGMREYADADTGEALGAESFGWTAALLLWEHGRTA